MQKPPGVYLSLSVSRRSPCTAARRRRARGCDRNSTRLCRLTCRRKKTFTKSFFLIKMVSIVTANHVCRTINIQQKTLYKKPPEEKKKKKKKVNRELVNHKNVTPAIDNQFYVCVTLQPRALCGLSTRRLKNGGGSQSSGKCQESRRNKNLLSFLSIKLQENSQRGGRCSAHSR